MDTADSGKSNGYATTGETYDRIGGKAYERDHGDITDRDLCIDWIISELKSKPGSRVLDIGCGTGRPASARLAAAGHQVLGIDVSDAMIQAAKTHVPNGTFEKVDVRSYAAPEESFDAISSYFSLFYMPRASLRDIVRQIHSWLKPQGLFSFMIVPGDWEDEWRPFIGQKMMESRFSIPEWLDIIKEAGFEISKYSVTEYDTPEAHEREQLLAVYARKKKSS